MTWEFVELYARACLGAPADRHLTDDERGTRNEERGDIVGLAFIGRALQRLTDEVGILHDQMTVLVASVLRHERMLDGILEEMRDIRRETSALVAQNTRIVDRLRKDEEGGDTFEDRFRRIDERLDTIEASPGASRRTRILIRRRRAR